MINCAISFSFKHLTDRSTLFVNNKCEVFRTPDLPVISVCSPGFAGEKDALMADPRSHALITPKSLFDSDFWEDDHVVSPPSKKKKRVVVTGYDSDGNEDLMSLHTKKKKNQK